MGERDGDLRGLLQGMVRGLALIQATRCRESQRVMLGCLYRDLDVAKAWLAGAPPELVALYGTVRGRAAQIRRRVGSPLEPDCGEGLCPPAPAGAGRFTPFLQRVPDAAVWLDAGLNPREAAALVGVGITDVHALAARTREEILAIRGVGKHALERCERLLGRRLASVPGDWRDKGLPARVAHVLWKAGIASLEALAAKTREDLASLGLGAAGLRACERLLGRPIPSRVDDWKRVGVDARMAWRLVRARIFTLSELRARSRAELAGLGFTRNDLVALERADLLEAGAAGS